MKDTYKELIGKRVKVTTYFHGKLKSEDIGILEWENYFYICLKLDNGRKLMMSKPFSKYSKIEEILGERGEKT